MRFKFTATIVTQVAGEVDMGGDHINVMSGEKMLIIPTYMLDGAQELKELSEDERKMVMHVITHNLFCRAVEETKVPEVETGQPIPTLAPDGGKLN